MANPEIDLARALEGVFWGWQIPVYLFLGGLAAGVMILSSLLALRGGNRSPAARLLAFAPALLVSIGMGALFLDLSRRGHVWRFYAAFRPASPMSWGAWILLAVYPISLAFAIRGLSREPISPRLSWANLAAGAGLGVYTGILLGTLGARALWNSALLGPLFLASGVSSGAAFLLLFRLDDAERHFAARWDLAALAIEALLLALYFVGLSTGGAAAKDAAGLLLGGRYTGAFWTLVVIAGLAIPWALEWLEVRKHFRAAAVVPALVLIGGLSLRFILVGAGQA